MSEATRALKLREFLIQKFPRAGTMFTRERRRIVPGYKRSTEITFEDNGSTTTTSYQQTVDSTPGVVLTWQDGSSLRVNHYSHQETVITPKDQ